MHDASNGRPGRKPAEKYDDATRARAMGLARAGLNATAIARELGGLPPSTVQVWIAPVLEAHGRAAKRLATALAFKADVSARMAERDRLNARCEPCIYVDVLGDPPPGRSALDRMRAEGRPVPS